MSDRMTFQEKRRYPRLDSLNLISYSRLDERELPDDGGIGRTMDLSKGGVTIQIHKPLPIHSALHLDIALEEKLIAVRGRVVHVQKLDEDRYDIGVSFLQIGDEDLKTLQEYFDQTKAKRA